MKLRPINISITLSFLASIFPPRLPPDILSAPVIKYNILVIISLFSLSLSDLANKFTYSANLPVVSFCINVCNDATFPIAFTSGIFSISSDIRSDSFSIVLYDSESNENSPIFLFRPSKYLIYAVFTPSIFSALSEIDSIPNSFNVFNSFASDIPFLLLSCHTSNL